MNSRTRYLVGLALILAVGANLAAQAGEGRRPIYQPTTITESGHYYLTRDIVGDLTIDADDVVLDLNGWLVDSTGTAIGIANGRKNVTVRNGTIKADAGIDTLPGPLLSAGIVIDDVDFEVLSYGAVLESESADIRNCVFRGGYLYVEGAVRVTDNLFAATGTQAIEVAAAEGGAILRNTILGLTGAGSRGIYVGGDGGVLIADNTIGSAPTSQGINIKSDGNTIRGNLVTGVDTAILTTRDHNRIVDNHVSDCEIGIYALGDFNYVAGNTTLGSVNGLALNGTEQVVEGNTSCGNTVDFLDLGTATHLGTTNLFCVP